MATRKDAEERNREKQQQQIDQQHEREAAARPDPIHRAVHFLLDQAILNNRDSRREAEFHKRNLDSRLAVPEKVAELEQPAPTAADTDEPESTAAPALSPTAQAGDAARQMKRSKRFQR